LSVDRLRLTPKEREAVEVQIMSDGVTVWVNGPNGSLARFGAMGIDVHTADTTGCLYCTHGPTATEEQWRAFVDAVAEHHHVAVTDDHRPGRIRPAAPQPSRTSE
jgi:hypothetical protein